MAAIKVGFIGYGNSVKIFHLPYILPNPDLEVYAFLQRAEAPSDRSNDKPGSHCTIDFPQARHYRTAEDFFADQAIELVIVCSHTDTHAQFAERALRAVVVEKPFVSTTEEADRLITIANQSSKILTVFQNRRHDGDFLTLQHLHKSGAFGTITEAEIHYDFESPAWMSATSAPEEKYTPGQGMLFGLGSHTIDQALLLFGRPKSVTSFLRSLRGIKSEIDDTFTVILEYESPLLVTIKTTITTPMQDQLKYLIRGTQGSYIKYGTDAQEEHAIRGMPTDDPAFGVEPERLHGLLTTYTKFDGQCQTYDSTSHKYVGRYPTITGRIRGYYENLAAAIRGKAELAVKPEQSRDVIRLIELARLSHDTRAITLWS